MARRPSGAQPVRDVSFTSARPQGRVRRRPQHRFQVRTPPWCIQPVAIAPVLPGETIESARIQARVVTDPLQSKLVGWWTELHLFYVKHRDTAYSTNFQSMVLNPTAATGLPTVSGSAGATYRAHGKPDYVDMCLKSVTNWWFRDQGDDASDFTHALNGLPLARLGSSDWSDSLIPTSELTSSDFSVDLDASGTITASEVEKALWTWEMLRDNNLTDMTYEDFLETYGVRAPRVAVNRPELLRSIREWSYPTNTVTQGTGAVTSACVWSIAESVSKKRFFAEPGFLFLVSVSKPKVFRRQQNGAMVNMLDSAYGWLPAVLRDDPETSLINVSSVFGGIANAGVVPSMTFDARDLFLYGDQFMASTPSISGGDSVAGSADWTTNVATEVVKFGAIAGFRDNFRPDYPRGTLAETNFLFAGTTSSTNLVQVEGVISLDIAGSVTDMTPGQPDRS